MNPIIISKPGKLEANRKGIDLFGKLRVGKLMMMTIA